MKQAELLEKIKAGKGVWKAPSGVEYTVDKGDETFRAKWQLCHAFLLKVNADDMSNWYLGSDDLRSINNLIQFAQHLITDTGAEVKIEGATTTTKEVEVIKEVPSQKDALEAAKLGGKVEAYENILGRELNIKHG